MEDKSSEFSVLVDRANGGSSISDGEIELMLHRYLYYFKVVSLFINRSNVSGKRLINYTYQAYPCR